MSSPHPRVSRSHGVKAAPSVSVSTGDCSRPARLCARGGSLGSSLPPRTQSCYDYPVIPPSPPRRYGLIMEEHTIDEVYDRLDRLDEVHDAVRAMIETVTVGNDSLAMLTGMVRDLHTDVENRVLRAEHEALMVRVSRLEAAIA